MSGNKPRDIDRIALPFKRDLRKLVRRAFSSLSKGKGRHEPVIYDAGNADIQRRVGLRARYRDHTDASSGFDVPSERGCA